MKEVKEVTEVKEMKEVKTVKKVKETKKVTAILLFSGGDFSSAEPAALQGGRAGQDLVMHQCSAPVVKRSSVLVVKWSRPGARTLHQAAIVKCHVVPWHLAPGRHCQVSCGT